MSCVTIKSILDEYNPGTLNVCKFSPRYDVYVIHKLTKHVLALRHKSCYGHVVES